MRSLSRRTQQNRYWECVWAYLQVPWLLTLTRFSVSSFILFLKSCKYIGQSKSPLLVSVKKTNINKNDKCKSMFFQEMSKHVLLKKSKSRLAGILYSVLRIILLLLNLKYILMNMSHFSYACKMRYPLNLVFENCEYHWFYLTFWIAILDCDLKLHKLSIHTLVILQKWLEIY